MAQLTAKYPDAAARVFIDILNEPDSFQLQWQAQADAGLPGAGDLYLAAMDAIYPVNNGDTLLSRPKEGWVSTLLPLYPTPSLLLPYPRPCTLPGHSFAVPCTSGVGALVAE